MGVALYRKYRSKKLGEVIGQEHITSTLEKAIKSGHISHAYLFTGPRGVGKTSIARILAHEVNGLDYKDSTVHLDIIEIDAASNRRIDEIRDLRDKVHITPTSAKYKVYIIDEVHMLTREAFNALLKTLEEPPAHCIFILATTEAHKLPETIISRTQRFSFRPITPAAIASHLRFIAGKEKFEADDDALLLLAEHADGSFRDAISMLDQLGGGGQTINRQSVLDLLGTPPAALLQELWSSMGRGDSQAVLRQSSKLKDQGFSAPTVSSELSRLVRENISENGTGSGQLGLLRELLDVASSPQPQQSLEIALLSYISNHESGDNKPPPAADRQSPKKPATQLSVSHQRQETAEPLPIADGRKPIPSSGQFSTERWPEALEAVKSKAASLYTALRLAEPRYEKGVFTLAFQFPLHQKKFKQPANEHLLLDILGGLDSGIERLEFIVDPGLKPALVTVNAAEEPTLEKLKNSPPANETLDNINNIFGGAEVLES